MKRIALAAFAASIAGPAMALSTGHASYYGKELAGRKTASGEKFNPAAMTAAHRSLPFGTRLRLTNPRTGHSVVVRINDRGPFVRGRVLDVSHGAARALGFAAQGTARLQIEPLERGFSQVSNERPAAARRAHSGLANNPRFIGNALVLEPAGQ
jgi:rare lipoprotein A